MLILLLCHSVLHELINWVRQRAAHLRGDKQFFDTLMVFLEGLSPSLDGVKQLEDTVLLHLATKHLDVDPNEKFRQFVMTAATSPSISEDGITTKVPKFDFAHHGDPRLLAQQLC